ncbi:MAG: hypothetical protein O7G83_02620 [Proteobacteria bacterium]|nr:hypothetical protein [Pseudomonadota bacterium]
MAFDLMDRMDLDGSFRHIERRRAFYRMMMYWLSLFEGHKPDRVLFNVPPHSVAEYTLYAACCIRDVSTIIFFPTAVNGLHLVGRRLFEVQQKLIESYQERLNADALSITEKDRTHFNLHRRTYEDAEPWYTNRNRRREDRSTF